MSDKPCSEIAKVKGIPWLGVSKDGRLWCKRFPKNITVKGIIRGTKYHFSRKWIEKKVSLDKRGYRRVKVDGENRYIAHMVLETFVGPRPKGMECCHTNGIKTDNSLKNLRWDTHKENSLDKIRVGAHQRGERNPRARISDSMAIKFINEFKTRNLGKSKSHFIRKFSEENKCPITSLNGIVWGKRWNHLKE